MGSKLHGVTVTLYTKTLSGYDVLNNPIYTVTTTAVDNVLIGQPTTEEIVSDDRVYGKKLEYVLGIPKGDTHNWEDTRVDFFGKTFRTFGETIEGIDDLIPLDWNKKVRVERYGEV